MRTRSRHWSFFETLYSIRPRGRDDERILRMNPAQLPYRWKKLKEAVNLPDGMVMYDLRHYHGSVMAACGAPARYIADDMGHSDISITNKFYIEEIAEKRQEINTAMFEHTADLLKNANISKQLQILQEHICTSNIFACNNPCNICCQFPFFHVLRAYSF